MKKIHYIIATGLGSGYSPLAPGTAGSLLMFLLLWWWEPAPFLLAAVLLLLFIVGSLSAGVVERELGEDPSIVVVDEIVGMGISALFVTGSWKLLLLAFIAFRAFDILKPPPVKQAENIPGGWGIMMDDVVAGFYGLAVVNLVHWLGWL